MGSASEDSVIFRGIEVAISDDPAKEVWIQNPPKPGRGRPSPYVQGLEFIIRKLSVMLEEALRDKAQLTQSLRRAQDTAADDARNARRENARLNVEKEELQGRVREFEAAEAEHGRKMAAKEQELDERAGQVRDAQAQVRLREEQHQEALDNLKKAHAEQLAALRAEQERETDQLNESHQQIVEAMKEDSKSVRKELQELQSAHEELKERNEGLDNAKQAFQEAAQQADTLLRLITSVTGFISPVHYVLFADNEGEVVEDQTYVAGEGAEADSAPSHLYIHGEHIGITYEQGPPPRMIAYPMNPNGNIAEQEVPLDEQGVPTLAGLVLLNFLKAAEANPHNSTIEGFRDHPLFQRLIFGDPDVGDTDEDTEETSETE